jgi:hypothetical protein
MIVKAVISRNQVLFIRLFDPVIDRFEPGGVRLIPGNIGHHL